MQIHFQAIKAGKVETAMYKSTHPNATATERELNALLASVPCPHLHIGLVGGDKPGILAGDIPVCRTRDGAEGAAYASLIVEAVNALPHLLAALQAHSSAAAAELPTTSGREDLRPQVEAKIAAALKMQSGLSEASIRVCAKLVFAAVEPWLSGAREVFDASEVLAPAKAVSVRTSESVSSTLAQTRLDAVVEFGQYLLSQGGNDEWMPCAESLEKLVNDWNATHNSPVSDQHQSVLEMA